MVGVVAAAFKIGVFGAAKEVGMYAVGVVLALGLGVGPKARVVILDSTQPLGIYGVVDNVPWSVAYVGSVTSGTGYHITRRMETLLAAPNDLSYQKSGMMFGATIVSQAARWRAVTPVVNRTLVNFMENCMVDGSNIGIVDINELVYSGNLSNFISSNVPQSLAYYDPVLDATTTCAQGWPQIQNMLTTEVRNVLNQKAAAHYGSGPTVNLPAAANQIGNTLAEFQTMIGMASAGASETIRQSMLTISMDDAIQRLIASSGNNAAMTAYQAARSEAQTSESYNTIGTNALKWVPLLKIVFETIYYGAFPLAMVLMMTPMVWTVLKGYFGGFVWLAAWDPLSAILHSTLMGRSAGYYREAMGTFNGTNIDYVMSFANQFGVRSVQQDVSSIAGYLMMSVPFIATIIFYGAGRMAGMATSMLAVGQQAATETAREGATGNIALANASMNNMAANKYNTSSLHDTGVHTQRLANGAFSNAHRDGSTSYSAGTAQSTGGMSARVGQTIREEVSDRKEAAIRTANSAREEWSTAVNETAANYADFGRSLSDGTTVGRDNSTTSSNRQITEAREAHQVVEDFAKQHGISVDAAYGVALRGGVPKWVPARGEFTGDLSGRDSDSYTNLVKAARESGLSETVSKFAEASRTVRAGSQSSLTDTESGGNRWSIEDVRRKGDTYAEAREEAETLSAAESALYSKGVSYDGQLTNAIVNEWQDAGLSDEQISQLMNPRTTQGVKRQEQAVEQVLPDLLNELGLDRPSQDLTSAFTLKKPEEDIRTYELPSAGTAHNAEYERVTEATGKVESAIVDRKAALEGEATSKAARTEREVIDGQDLGAVPGMAVKVATTLGDIWDSGGDALNGAKNWYQGNEPLTHYDRDVMIRTIHGEAGRESETGQAAVAHVIMNRVADGRWGDNPAEVSMELKQFSAWNSGVGGNSLPTSLEEGSPQYERIGRIVDSVAAGEIADPTDGATHYYSPAGMRAHVAAGEQSNEIPRWLERESSARGEPNVRIGGHVFTGRRRDE